MSDPVGSIKSTRSSRTKETNSGMESSGSLVTMLKMTTIVFRLQYYASRILLPGQ